MGVDLRWLVMGGGSMDHNYSPTMIEVGQDYDYHKKIRGIQDYDPPKDVGCFLAEHPEGDYQYGSLPPCDAYGERHRMVLAGDIAKIEYEPRYEMLAAAIAYIKVLRPETMIVLSWH